jgi:hypothetical protein
MRSFKQHAAMHYQVSPNGPNVLRFKLQRKTKFKDVRLSQTSEFVTSAVECFSYRGAGINLQHKHM